MKMYHKNASKGPHSFVEEKQLKRQIYFLIVIAITLVVATFAWFSDRRFSITSSVEMKAKNVQLEDFYFCMYDSPEAADGSCANKVKDPGEFYTYSNVFPGQEYVVEIVINDALSPNTFFNYTMEFKNIDPVKKFMELKAEKVTRTAIGPPSKLEDITFESTFKDNSSIQPIKNGNLIENQANVFRISVKFKGEVENADGEKEYFGNRAGSEYRASGYLWVY